MAKLIYSAITSLDGYVADADGNFDWADPAEDLQAFVNDLEREIGTYLYGRRMYEVMVAWEHPETFADEPVTQDFAQIWQAAEKVVFSTTLETVSSEHTRIERSFDADEIRRMKADSTRDISVGGPGLAAETLRAGLVDECHLFRVRSWWAAGSPLCPPVCVSRSTWCTSAGSQRAWSTCTTASTGEPESSCPTGLVHRLRISHDCPQVCCGLEDCRRRLVVSYTCSIPRRSHRSPVRRCCPRPPS